MLSFCLVCDNCYFCLCNALCKVTVGNTSMWINTPEGFMEIIALHIRQHVLNLEHGFFLSQGASTLLES
jgi:hypothetical protein